MRRVRISMLRSFLDFAAFKKIFHFLADEIELVYDEVNPDVTFVFCFGPDWLNFDSLPKARRLVFFDMEPQATLDLSKFDYAITLNQHFDQYGSSHIFYPGFLCSLNWSGRSVAQLLQKPESPQRKSKFCNFVQSSPNALREQFTQQLSSRFKHVDCAGSRLNNVEKIKFPDNGTTYDAQVKLDFIKDYRFTIAFENVPNVPHYITEKLVDPMFVGSLPIYAGAPNVGEYFNTKSFINCTDFRGPVDVIERVRELEDSPARLTELLRESWFIGNRLPAALSDETLRERLAPVFR